MRGVGLKFFGNDPRTLDFALLSSLLGAIGWAGEAAAGEPPRVLRHVVVYGEPGRFAGWPANHGIWSWGDEILVGFSRGYYKDRGPCHHIDHDKAEEFIGAEPSGYAIMPSTVRLSATDLVTSVRRKRVGVVGPKQFDEA